MKASGRVALLVGLHLKPPGVSDWAKWLHAGATSGHRAKPAHSHRPTSSPTWGNTGTQCTPRPLAPGVLQWGRGAVCDRVCVCVCM